MTDVGLSGFQSKDKSIQLACVVKGELWALFGEHTFDAS